MNRLTPKGFTLIEFLVAATLISIVLSALLAAFTETTQRSHNDQVMARTDQEAHAILDVMAYDLRMAGSGMPIGQANFRMTDAALGTATLPLLTPTTAVSVQLRLNETGRDTVLTQSFTPSSTSRTFSVVDASIFAVEDTIYLNDMPLGGTSGLRGTITSISGNQITIAGDYVSSSAAIFAAGTLANRVTDVAYRSSSADGITRDPEFGAVPLNNRGQFSLRFFDSAGTEITLPLDATKIQDQVTQVEISIQILSSRTLRDGNRYTGRAKQRVALRNLIMSRS